MRAAESNAGRSTVLTLKAPNMFQDVLTSIEDSISLAYDTNIQNILITGDFNLYVLKSSFNKMVLRMILLFILL